MHPNKPLIIIISIIIVILCCCTSVGAVYVGIGLFGINSAQTQADELMYKSGLYDYKIRVDQYYVNHNEYPVDLETAGVPDNVLGKTVIYRLLSDSSYSLSMMLPSGEIYTLDNNSK
ncbi:MAG: hypothetical protein WCJ58_04130 [bacterium]